MSRSDAVNCASVRFFARLSAVTCTLGVDFGDWFIVGLLLPQKWWSDFGAVPSVHISDAITCVMSDHALFGYVKPSTEGFSLCHPSPCSVGFIHSCKPIEGESPVFSVSLFHVG